MTQALSLDVDRILTQWVRLGRVLANHAQLGLVSYDVIRGIERRIVMGRRLREAILDDPRIARLCDDDRQAILRAAREDWRKLQGGQADLLSTSVTESLEALLCSSTDAVADIIPRFADLRHDFISHHSDSVGAGALLFAEALELRGRKSWIAPRNIARLVDWNDELFPAIENCGEFILLMSTHSARSSRVKGEVLHAVEYGRRIIAVALDPHVRAELFDIGLKAKQVPTIRWDRGLGSAKDASDLAEAVITLLQKERLATVPRTS